MTTRKLAIVPNLKPVLNVRLRIYQKMFVILLKYRLRT